MNLAEFYIGKGAEWNEAQEIVVPHIGKNINTLIDFRTGVGKTFSGNAIVHDCLYKEKKKVVYIAPMKALVEQMKELWTSDKHPYSKLKLEIITGDYVEIWENDTALNNADIIVTTPESFTSRMRNIKAKKSRFLDDVGAIWIDEIHLLGEIGRGVNLEAGLMEFTAEYPNIPILGTSGTMPNADQLGKWLTKLNGLETAVIKSDYRPVPLELSFIPIGNDREGDERAAIVARTKKEFPDEQMMIGVAAKNFGRKLLKKLEDDYKIKAEFHNADRSMQERKQIERRLMTGDLETLITTKTMFAGINSGVGIVVCTAVKNAGGAIPAAEIQQMIGRAGRQGWTELGRAIVCVPRDDFQYHRDRIIRGEDVISGFRTCGDLALHFLGAIYIGRIKKQEDFYVWYDRTLRQHQQPLMPMKKEQLLNQIVEEMVSRGMIGEEPDGSLTLKRRGTIAAQMGIDPYYMYELILNMQKFLAFDGPTDAQLAKALGNCSMFFAPIYPGSNDWNEVPAEVRVLGLNDNYIRSVSAHYLLLKGEYKLPEPFVSLGYQIKQDIERIGFALERLNGECEHWRDDRIPLIPFRVYYGASWAEARLINQGLSHAAAKRCLKADVKNLSELKKYPDLAKELLTVKQRKRIGLNA